MMHGTMNVKISLKNLREVDVGNSISNLNISNQYLNISNSFAALEKLNDSKNINNGWENIKENIKISDNEFLGQLEKKKCELWFDEECSQSILKRKQGELCF
jgi:hypothetical protein